MSDVDVQLT